MPQVDEPKPSNVNVRLSEQLRSMLEERAQELGLTVSELLRHIVISYFGR